MAVESGRTFLHLLMDDVVSLLRVLIWGIIPTLNADSTWSQENPLHDVALLFRHCLVHFANTSLSVFDLGSGGILIQSFIYCLSVVLA